MVDMYYSVIHDILPAEKADEMVADITARHLNRCGQAEVVSSEHVGDEFHFRLRIPMPKLPEIPQVPGRVAKATRERGETC